MKQLLKIADFILRGKHILYAVIAIIVGLFYILTPGLPMFITFPFTALSFISAVYSVIRQ